MSQADHDEFLELFTRRKPKAGEAARWLTEWLKETAMVQTDITQIEGFFDLYLESIPAEKRLDGLEPEERLLGLDRDQQALALSVEVLRALPETNISFLQAEWTNMLDAASRAEELAKSA